MGPAQPSERLPMTDRIFASEVSVFWRRREATGGDALAQRLRSGEVQAIGEAYDLHHAAVRAFARRLVGDADVAEDLVQEVFVTLPKAIKRFDGRSALRTFVISIAINHARHHLRAAARRRQAWQRAAELPGAPARGPEHASDDSELARALARAMDTLPTDQRVAFVLCAVEERSSGEAAAILDVPEATVRTRLFHARRKLREALEREGVR